MLVNLFVASFFTCTKSDGEISARLGSSAIHLSWNVDFADQSVLFTVNQMNTPLGYVIIGFSDHGFYNNSDICIFRNGKLRAGTTQFIIAGGYQFTHDFSSSSVMKEMRYGLLIDTDDSRDQMQSEGAHFKVLAGNPIVCASISCKFVYKLVVDVDLNDETHLIFCV
ncbi:hypothetical protein ANCCAN_15536 [Ancylostoma caninum]|uniref:DOMON domain-containing protein n=1 Tax=Ancylostoma caninum TaxID=29170 RepID=A0A368G690_ANCCA|nr:hypothetical protein ANCCAN_15536 [Ancylostoma caninum]